jgi:hypothetical protein
MLIKILIYLHLVVPAQIHGTVIDKGTNENLCGVSISLSDGNRLYTDFDGHFIIITTNLHQLMKVEYPSYMNSFYRLESTDEIIIELVSR